MNFYSGKGVVRGRRVQQLGFALSRCVLRQHLGAGFSRANFSISAMRPPCYSLVEEIVILGVIYGSLAWRVCNPGASLA